MARLRVAAIALTALACLFIFAKGAIAGTRSFTDSAGRHVEVPDTVGRVFAAGPPAAVILYTLVPDKLVGWPRAPAMAARAFLPPRYADLPVVGRLTGHANTADLAAVTAMHPDIIVDVGDVEPEYAELADRVQKETGIPYVLIDGSLAKTGASYRTLGALLGEPSRARELADYADNLLSDVHEKLAGTGALRVYFGRGKDGLETGRAGSINMEVLEAVGATNVGAALGEGELTKVTPAQIIAWNPDAIVTLDPKFLSAVSSDPQWQPTAAVHAHRLYLSPTQPFGWMDEPPGVNRLLGVRWLAARLHPQAVSGDLREIARDFYTRFYHQTPSEAQLDELLRIATTAP